MGWNLNGILGRTGGEGQRCALGLRIGRQTVEFERELPRRRVAAGRLWQRQRPLGRRSLDEKLDRLPRGRGDLDHDALVRAAGLAADSENGETFIWPRILAERD